jgi:uncharacterized protein (TIGR00369 family)
VSSIVELARAARAGGDPAPLVAAIPYARFLGISCARRPEGLVTSMTFAPHLVGNSLIGALHGGALGSLLESAAVFAVLLESESLPKTITITVEYLRSGQLADTFARAEITKLGRRIANARAVAWQADPQKPIASASVNFLLRPA